MLLFADENFPKPAVEALRSGGHNVLWARTDVTHLSRQTPCGLATSAPSHRMEIKCWPLAEANTDTQAATAYCGKPEQGRITTSAAELFRRYAKYSLDALSISDCNLDMSFFPESGPRIGRVASREHAFHRIDGGHLLRLKDCMRPAKDRTVEIPPKPVMLFEGSSPWTAPIKSARLLYAIFTWSRPVDVVRPRQSPNSMTAPITLARDTCVSLRFDDSIATSSPRSGFASQK